MADEGTIYSDGVIFEDLEIEEVEEVIAPTIILST